MDIHWTDRAAQQVIARGIDHEQALEAIHHGLWRKLFGRTPSRVYYAKLIVCGYITRKGLNVVTVMRDTDIRRARRNRRKKRPHLYRGRP